MKGDIRKNGNIIPLGFKIVECFFNSCKSCGHLVKTSFPIITSSTRPAFNASVSPDKVYDEIRDRFNKDHNALDFCLLSRTCFSGVIRFRKSDVYMSTPKGSHRPIAPEKFQKRVELWSKLIQKVEFRNENFEEAMSRPNKGDLVYCDPPYTHSQGIIYGAQKFDINLLWKKIEECKSRGAYVMLSINGTRESKKKDISIEIPESLFAREYLVDCGTSMIDRLQNGGRSMEEEKVHDKLLLTW